MVWENPCVVKLCPCNVNVVVACHLGRSVHHAVIFANSDWPVALSIKNTAEFEIPYEIVCPQMLVCTQLTG